MTMEPDIHAVRHSLTYSLVTVFDGRKQAIPTFFT